MTTALRCPNCSTSNAHRRLRCRACGCMLRGSGIALVGPKDGSRRAPEDFRKGKATRLVLDLQLRRLQEMEASAKRRAYERERRLMAREIALDRREIALAGRASESGATGAQSKGERLAPGAPAVLRAPGSFGASLSRIATHIPGLDGALHGGVPQGSVVLIAGAPGTMKTSLGLFILATNAISDLRGGLYITFGERAASLLRQMENLGLDFSQVEGRLEILDATLLSRSVKRGKRDWLDDLKGRVKALAEVHLQLLVIDSLEALEVLAKFDNRRVELFRLFEWLRDLGLTSFVIAERPDFIIRGNVFQGRHEEDFLADGMIQLRLHPVTDVQIQRRIRIVKMRGTAHDTGYMAFHLAPGKEFEVAPAIGA